MNVFKASGYVALYLAGFLFLATLLVGLFWSADSSSIPPDTTDTNDFVFIGLETTTPSSGKITAKQAQHDIDTMDAKVSAHLEANSGMSALGLAFIVLLACFCAALLDASNDARMIEPLRVHFVHSKTVQRSTRWPRLAKRGGSRAM